MDSEAAGASFTGRRRARKTRPAVIVADRAARALISVGGIGTIVAVLGVCLFLIWVVLPLFLPADVGTIEGFGNQRAERWLHLGVDEYRLLGWTLDTDGVVEVFRLDNGARRQRRTLLDDAVITSVSTLSQGEQVVLGLSDGSIALATIGFEAEILDPAALPAATAAALDAAADGQPIDFGEGVVQRTPSGQARSQRLKVELGRRTRVADGPVHRVAHVQRSNGPLIVAFAEATPGWSPAASAADPAAADPAAATPPREPRLVAIAGEERSNFLTGERTVSFDLQVALPLPPRAWRQPPDHLAVSGPGSSVYLAWRDGLLARLDTSDLESAFVAETSDLAAGDSTLEAFGLALGNNTLLWGESSGRVSAGFLVRVEELTVGALPDSERDPRATHAFVRSKALGRPGSASARSLGPSARSRLTLAGFDDGAIRLYNLTNETELATAHLPQPEPVLRLAMAPKEDGLVAITPSRVYHADLDPRYPEASFKALFRPVWYEGYSAPRHSWQSSSGSDDFEAKLGLMPLIFGTLKATLYSMMFGVPLALLAAIFTSEFLEPRVKSVIKPSIELMASLPSVVLGFLAALVFAPFVETVVPAILAGFFTLPLAFLLGAYGWQLLPVQTALRLGHWRFAFMALALPLGVTLAALIGPWVERLLFAGDLHAWLAWSATDGSDRPALASAFGGWALILLPFSALAVALAIGRWVSPRMRALSARWDRRSFAFADLAKFVAALVLTFALAFALAAICNALGLDPRGGVVDTYVQRNALIVGFVMGFAIIPIIYTISEDALQAVPEHLRSASLGAGATPWQTAVRIVVPTAMSGLFSAMMVGLGRAVGETMIVLMAAGNTPVMKWNIFEGFRTLSANIAVELPEAVQGSTHYRTLFLAALVLFAMTFVVNTVAEVIRLRFRKRAYQL